jgi:Uma2 family endonuclease
VTGCAVAAMLAPMSEAARQLPVLTDVDSFLDWVERQPERYEFVGGRLRLMAGGSTPHNDLQMNLHTALVNRLRGKPCRANGSDLAIKIDARTARFPDASVTVGPRGPNFTDDAVVVFEILSPSSEAEDRGAKRRDYQRLPGLRHYVLLAQDSVRAEMLTRTPAGWLLTEVEGLDAELRLDALELVLPLAELYAGVELAAA